MLRRASETTSRWDLWQQLETLYVRWPDDGERGGLA